MARLTRGMELVRWADGLATVTTCTLWVPIPRTQVIRHRHGYDLNAVNFKVLPSTGQGASLLRDLAVTDESLQGDSRAMARTLLEGAVKPTLAPGVALSAILEVVGYQTPVTRANRTSANADNRTGPWQSAMPADCGDSFAQCEGTSPKVAGIEQRRRVWCKTTERGHNAIVRRRARAEALFDGSGTAVWDGLPALMRKMPV